jgi:four helix bundle protein
MHRYRSLEAWKRAHKAALLTLQATDAAYHPKSRSLFDQIRRAAVSIEANIVEGYGLGSTAQFLRHLYIARGSAAEAECLVRLAVEVGYLGEERGGELETVISGSLATIHGLVKARRGTSIS